MPEPTREAVIEALRGVQDPELHKDIVSLGMVKLASLSGGRGIFSRGSAVWRQRH